MSWYVSENGIDVSSLELMCLYIKKCRNINNALINLNAKYELSFTYQKEPSKPPILKIIKNQNHLGLFDKYNVNLKIICGKNGSGKTTIIDLLRGKLRGNNYDYIVVYKDKENNFLATDKIEVNFKSKSIKLHIDGHRLDYSHSLTCASSAEHEIESMNISKGIALAYNANPKLYDFEGGSLFTNFIVDIWYDSIDSISSVFLYSDLSRN